MKKIELALTEEHVIFQYEVGDSFQSGKLTISPESVILFSSILERVLSLGELSFARRKRDAEEKLVESMENSIQTTISENENE